MHDAVQMHDKRLEDLVDTLKAKEPPVACNGFARVMRDSVVCLLEGQRITLQHATNMNWPKAFVAVSAIGTLSGTIFGIVHMACGK